MTCTLIYPEVVEEVPAEYVTTTIGQFVDKRVCVPIRRNFCVSSLLSLALQSHLRGMDPRRDIRVEVCA